MRITSTWGRAARLSRKKASFPRGRVRGSPPETITSRISGWSRTYSTMRSSSRETLSQPPRFIVARLRGAESAIHGADVGRHQQGAVGVAVGQAGDGRVLVLVERVVLLGLGGAGQFQRGGDRLEADRVGRVEGVDQGEVVGRDGRLVFGLEGVEGPGVPRARSAAVRRAAWGSGRRAATANASRPSRRRARRPSRGVGEGGRGLGGSSPSGAGAPPVMATSVLVEVERSPIAVEAPLFRKGEWGPVAKAEPPGSSDSKERPISHKANPGAPLGFRCLRSPCQRQGPHRD